MHDVLERLEFVETKAPLVFDEIDFTIIDPDGLVRVLAAPLEYAQRVEVVVAAAGIETLIPRHDDRVRRFLDVWTVDEVGHGHALAELMRHLGLTPTPEPEPVVPVHNQLIGLIGRASRRMHQVVESLWGTIGAMNEHLAMVAYARMGEIARERNERALHETLFRKLRAHESAHKSFYAAYAADAMHDMHDWQRKLARLVVEHTYTPVGAGQKRDRPVFAQTVRALAPDDWDASIATPVQMVAERLLNEGREFDPFVRRSIMKCLAAAPSVVSDRSPRG